ncbi:LacI family DNA-binding transcriptional regulator [Microbacterium sp. NPDC091313]
MRRKRTTMKDVADAARVSSTTASLVLGGRADEFRIHADTRRRVMEAADRLGYIPSGSTRRTPASQSPPLWVVFAPSDLEAGPINSFLRGLNRFITENSVPVTSSLMPYETGSVNARARWMQPSFASGFVFVGLDDADLRFIANEHFDVPAVFYNRVVGQHASVMVDDYAGGGLVGEHFLERGLERFALLATPQVSSPISMRAAGFMDALRARGLHDAEASVQRVVLDPSDEDQMADALDSIRVDERLGVFVLHDGQTTATMQWTKRRNLQVPADVEIAVYGDTAAHRTNDPSLTSVAIPSEEMGYECAQTLHHLTATPTLTGVRRTFQASLVLRQSSPGRDD